MLEGKHALPPRRKGMTIKFGVNGFEGYINCGEYEDGSLAEIFITIAKQGSTMAGWADAFAIAFSGALQWSSDPKATLRWLIDNLSGMRFEPYGATDDPDCPDATSVIDHAMHQLQRNYL